ncbi:MAG: bifunctional UDP-N-acetylglucosamine diphosphorylase/glucosamine-1-phosphate N-acetyltransferase GlmU [Betaproteobacteria bacterium]|nr:bifunctional UDP-N-acetylglucosamine diphosphorylase/glucosamine-1-phosphate N-acetyltransferase GlmU [Betaproteobacteria bacterium]
MNVVVLAAGRGTRMRSELPKVLQPLAGRPMLAHVLVTARLLAPQRICVVYGYGGEQVLAAMSMALDGVTWVEQAQQLGTGHALMQAMPHLNNAPVTLVLYGDVPLVQVDTLRALVEQAARGKLAVLTVDMAQPAGYGRIVRAPSGVIVRIVEERDADAVTREIVEVNTGIMALPTNKLADWLSRLNNDNQQNEYYLTDVVALAAEDGVVAVASQPTHEWEVMGVNDKVQLAAVERQLQWNCAERLMLQGVTILDPTRIDVRGNLQCGRDVSIDVGCVFSGEVVLGDDVSVGACCVLRDVVIGAGTRIAPFSHLEHSQVGANNHIGPYARLRPGAELGNSVHIGNFVEIKNSRVDDGSKINHLSYVGDSMVGKRVNIGAGTITCNYDGANKHRTVIEDDVFVGSGTELVAPVTVGTGATVGAGSTITRDTPAGELTLSRVRQVTISGWKRPVKKGIE